ncbi:MAG: hypothetical protein IT340_01265 [Chloroflexi bacterium]|nr:hypothetical protein [Chloroflexota bacterium]
MLTRRQAAGLGLGVLGGSLLAACGVGAPAGGHGATSSGGVIAWPARNQWPPVYHESSARVQAAYQFAVSPAGRETLRWQPCYCGCEEEGHTSNLDCFVDEVRADGSVALDLMSFG